MSPSNLTSVVLFLGVCILISLGAGYLLVEHLRLLEKFSTREGMASGETVAYFFYSSKCPYSADARKVWEKLREYPGVRKLEIDCSDPKNEELCAREGIDKVPTFKVTSPIISRHIHDWRQFARLAQTIDESLQPPSVQISV